MILKQEDIFKALQKDRDLLKGYGVKSLGLFGSFARGENSEDSDLDFVVEFEKKSFDGYMDLKEHLERTFGRKVDLVIADALKPRLKPIIQGETVNVPGL